jgi:metallo-beta-lactamase family protein
MELEFYGAAGRVTGSCHILRVGSHQLLLDCGLIQGRREDEEKNREPFPFDPADIDAVVLSHAHIDHSGRLPLLVKRGFRGPIYTQNASRDLCRILLQDSARLNERDAEYENRRRAKKGQPPIPPLYTPQDADASLKTIEGLRYAERREILPGVDIRFHDAGHIMGSAMVEVWVREGAVDRKLVFSGDLGQYDSPILNDPARIEDADLVVMECTYGNRRHRDRAETIREIGEVVSDAAHEKGNILIPAFAIGRTQEVLYTFGKHYDEWEMSRWHIFLDSPMAIAATDVYLNYPHLYDEEANEIRAKLNGMPLLPNLHQTESTEESMVINRVQSGAVIIAGSGMCTGGRIIHHLRHNVSRRGSHVIIVGYQANGTLGRRLVDGDDKIRIYGEEYRVRAKVHTVGGLSAHGDQEDLLRWVGGFEKRPPVYLVHGEPDSARAFSRKLGQALQVKATVAKPGQTVDLASL